MENKQDEHHDYFSTDLRGFTGFQFKGKENTGTVQ